MMILDPQFYPNYHYVAHYPPDNELKESEFIFWKLLGKDRVVAVKYSSGVTVKSNRISYPLSDELELSTSLESVATKVCRLVNEVKYIPQIRDNKVSLDLPPRISHSAPDVSRVTSGNLTDNDHSASASTVVRERDRHPEIVPGSKQKLALITKNLLQICSFDRRLPRLIEYFEFNNLMLQYRHLCPGFIGTNTQLVRNATTIFNSEGSPEWITIKYDGFKLPYERFSRWLDILPSEEIPRSLFKLKISKIDPGFEPESYKRFLKYVWKSCHGFFLSRENEKDTIKMKETVLSHLFYLCDRLETDPPPPNPNISRLYEDLKRSLPLAFQGEVIGTKRKEEKNPETSSSSSSSSSSALYAQADELSIRIYNNVSNMQPGERLFLPLGFTDHATLLIIEKNKEGMENIEITHINTGYGADTNRVLVKEEKTKGVTGWFRKLLFGSKKTPVLKAKANFNHEKRKAIERCFAGLIRIAYGQKTDVGEMNSFLYELTDGRGFVPDKNKDKMQNASNCSYEVLLRAIEIVLGEEVYQNFKNYLIDKLKEDCEIIRSGIRARIEIVQWTREEAKTIEEAKTREEAKIWDRLEAKLMPSSASSSDSTSAKRLQDYFQELQTDLEKLKNNLIDEKAKRDRPLSPQSKGKDSGTKKRRT